VKRGVAPSRLSASLMSRPMAVEGSTRGYRPITTLKPPIPAAGSAAACYSRRSL
jgi:hypothetical protein